VRLPSGCPPYQLEEGTHENHDRLDTGCDRSGRSGILRSAAAARAAATATATAGRCPDAAAAAAAADGRARPGAFLSIRAGIKASFRTALPGGHALFA